MTIVRSLDMFVDVFMDLYSLFTYRDVGGMRVNPASAIEIIRSALVPVHGGMGVSAKNADRLMVAGMGQGPVGNFRRQAQPARVEPIKETGQRFIFRIPLLQLQVEQRPDYVAD